MQEDVANTTNNAVGDSARRERRLGRRTSLRVQSTHKDGESSARFIGFSQKGIHGESKGGRGRGRTVAEADNNNHDIMLQKSFACGRVRRAGGRRWPMPRRKLLRGRLRYNSRAPCFLSLQGSLTIKIHSPSPARSAWGNNLRNLNSWQAVKQSSSSPDADIIRDI